MHNGGTLALGDTVALAVAERLDLPVRTVSAGQSAVFRGQSTTRYVTVQTSTVALHTAYSRVDEQSEEWNARAGACRPGRSRDGQ